MNQKKNVEQVKVLIRMKRALIHGLVSVMNAMAEEETGSKHGVRKHTDLVL